MATVEVRDKFNDPYIYIYMARSKPPHELFLKGVIVKPGVMQQNVCFPAAPEAPGRYPESPRINISGLFSSPSSGVSRYRFSRKVPGSSPEAPRKRNRAAGTTGQISLICNAMQCNKIVSKRMKTSISALCFLCCSAFYLHVH